MNIVWRKLTQERDGIPAWLAEPGRPGPHPAVLMLHHAPGLTGDYKSNAASLAQLGFTVLVPNLYNMLGIPGDHHIGQGAAIQAKHGDADFLRVIGQAFRFVQALPSADPARVGAIGHCLGGRLGIPFAADTPQLKALVLYYATIRDEEVTEMRPRHSYETARQVRCATQVIYGGRDHLTPNGIQLKLWQSFLEGGAPLDWHFLSEGNHGFANPDSEWYQPQFAQLAWPLTVQFLSRALDL
jgi:carboxymethylenebutenolidase